MGVSFTLDSAVNRGCGKLYNFGPGGLHPLMFTNARDELLAARKTAWLGTALSCSSLVYDISGPDAAKLLNKVCVNRDFAQLKLGRSRHALLCNEKGQLLADGVLIRTGEQTYRTYFLAPVLEYYVETLGLDIQGKWIMDEFFYQLDGPKSLEILEAATKTDLHSMRFAGRMNAQVNGKPITIIRLGMSGALAYEIHGDFKDADVVYDGILEAGKPFGIKQLGGEQYCENHTQGGYPNMSIHFSYPFLTSGEGLKKFMQARTRFYIDPENPDKYAFDGSANDDDENYFVTPYDIKWDYLINYDHDFIGKEALQKIALNPPKTCVTLEWNLDDVAKAYIAQIVNIDTPICDDITQKCFNGGSTSKVLLDGKMVGTTSGRIQDYYHGTMISLAFIEKELAVEGKKLKVLWGSNGYPQMEIHATVAAFPYYNEEYRNETFDVEKIPHPEF